MQHATWETERKTHFVVELVDDRII